MYTYHIVPRRDDGFHVEIAREEGDDAVWDDLAVFGQDATKVAYHRRVVAYFEPRADGHLVTPSGDHLERCVECVRTFVKDRMIWFDRCRLSCQRDGKQHRVRSFPWLRR